MISAQTKQKKEDRPLLHSLTSLQQEAILKEMNHLAGSQQHSTNRRYQQLKSKLSGLEKSEENLFAAIEKGNARTQIAKRLERVSKEKEQVENEINSLNRTKYTFTESSLNRLKDHFTAYMQSQGDIYVKHLIKSLIKRVDVSEINVKITLADGISVDKAVKNTMYKEKVTMKTVRVDAVLMNAKMKDGETVTFKFAVRRNGELGFTEDCELSMPESQMFAFADYSECDYFDFFGAKFDLTVQLNNQEQIVKVRSIEKATKKHKPSETLIKQI